jgi:hypothetical protein
MEALTTSQITMMLEDDNAPIGYSRRDLCKEFGRRMKEEKEVEIRYEIFMHERNLIKIHCSNYRCCYDKLCFPIL